jgi:hypothetical protein
LRKFSNLLNARIPMLKRLVAHMIWQNDAIKVHNARLDLKNIGPKYMPL